MRDRLKYLVPNSFTALSMLFGLASVAASAAGEYQSAAWFILWGVLLDKLDGTAARLLKATSGFGVQFDSFADFVVFGIAPAALCYFSVGGAVARPVLLMSIGFFVVATAGRLARFNIAEPPLGDRLFYGIPTTLVGAFLASGFLTWALHGAPESLLAGFPFLLVLSGVAMVSNVRLPKLKGRANPVVQWFQIINIAVVYAATPFKLLPEYLFALSVLYMAIGITWAARHPVEELLAEVA